ncbi:MAG: hypothetical protein Q4G67_01695 [Actinomycetia bacterium]|nr:hypothetical protein [Actinomycetes bacterium]
MFGKSHEQKAADKSAAALEEAKKAAKQRYQELRDAAADAGEHASTVRETVVEKAGVAGEKFQHGVDAVAPRVEYAKDTLVEDVWPKVAEGLAGFAATAMAAMDSAKEGAEKARDQAAVKFQDYVDEAPQSLVDAVPGVEKRPRKSGRWLVLLGLAAAGAAAYAYLNANKPKEDPWATPRYDSARSHGLTTSTGSEASGVDAVKEKAAAAGAAVAAKAGEVKDAVVEKAAEVKDQVTDSSDTAAMKTENAIDDLRTDPSGHAEDAFDSAKDGAGDVWDDVRGKDAGDKMADAADSLTDGDLGDAADSAGDAIGDKWDDVRGKDAGDKFADSADSAGKAAEDAWTDAKNWTEDKADDARS